MLEYDNSAFYYFALTLLAIYIIPGTYYALSEFCYAFLGSGEVGAKARSSMEKAKAQKLKSETTGWTRLKTNSYLVNLVFLLFAWALFIYLISLVKDHGQVSSFDPYSILGIEQGSTVAEIKKQYRKLSLKYHPDKNIGNKFAEEMFMKIAKAYEALTDETSKENYEKYGNPDGKQALEVSIGLPKALLENPKVVLVLYLIVMVVVIPSAVAIWYSNSKQYGEKNIKYDTYEAFYSLLQETHRMRNIAEILAASAEFREINQPTPSDVETLQKVYENLTKTPKKGESSDRVMLKPRFEQPKILRGNILLHSHMMRMTDDLNPALRKDLNSMLVKSPELLDGLIEIGQQRKWFETSIAAIKFSQCLVQALWPTADPFLQLPCFGEEEVKKIRTGAKGSSSSGGKAPAALSFAQFLKLSDSEKLGRVEAAQLKESDKAEFLQVCSLFPRLNITTKLFVEEEEEEEDGEPAANSDSAQTDNRDHPRGDQIFEQDLVTLKITLVRENIPDKGKKNSSSAAPVHAPYFPATLYENWWVVVADRSHKGHSHGPGKGDHGPIIHAFEKISDQGRTVTHEVKFYAPSQQGKYEVDLELYSDSYLGLDEVITIPFEVFPAASLPVYTPHPEDMELDNEPTVFEQLMANNQDESSDEDDDDDDEVEEEKQQQNTKKIASSAANTNRNNPTKNSAKPAGGKKKPTRVIEEVDDDEEE